MKLSIALILCMLTVGVLASKKAITEEGNVVILNDDGSWVYEDELAATDEKLKFNTNKFTKHKNSSFMLKSNKTDAAFWINPKKWSFKKNDNGHEAAEYTLRLKDSDLYGMVISEGLEVELEELVKIAFNNAKGAAPDTRIIKKEYREVNGIKVIYMEMTGTIQSIRFTYLGYYYSNASGSTQLLAYTGSNLVKKYRTNIDNFLNGFISR